MLRDLVPSAGLVDHFSSYLDVISGNFTYSRGNVLAEDYLQELVEFCLRIKKALAGSG